MLSKNITYLGDQAPPWLNIRPASGCDALLAAPEAWICVFGISNGF